MGILLSFLKGKDPAEVFIDFENAQPTDNEMDIYNRVGDLLGQGDGVMHSLEEYKGCQELARKAMSTPTLTNETEAFEGLLVAVDSISQFFNYSKQLEQTVPDLLMSLARGADNENKQSFQDQQALAKQLADVFNFALKLDQTRMLRPFLSNDFSYYRRLLPKFNKHPAIKVKDDDASGMALFTAEHIPMTSTLAKAAGSALEKNSYVTAALALMANSCMSMIKSKKFAKPETNLFCARAMTGAIVLFDHVDPIGAFHKKSPIALKQCILLLKREFPKEVGLLNAIHFSTKHFRDADSNIQALFD